MIFNYIDYKENIFERAIDSSKSRIYVFDNIKNMIKARENYSQPLLKPKSIFILFKDLKEKIFATDRLIIKEEKRAVIFYDLLTETEKERFNINTYFDSVDLAAEFFRFFNELNEYQIEVIKNLEKWQKQKYSFFKDLRERYLKRLQDLNYTDYTLTFDMNNFSKEFVNNYRELVFMNIIEFTPLEKKLLLRLEETGKKINIYLNIPQEDFDEINLKIKNVSLPDKLPLQLKLYETEGDLLQLTNMIAELRKEEEFSILDASKNSNYHRLLSSSQIDMDKDLKFTDTKIFRFLETLKTLYSNSVKEKGKFMLELNDLLQALALPEFRKYYGLEVYHLKKLQQLAGEDYIYISRELINGGIDELQFLNIIFDNIKKIAGFNNLYQVCCFLEEIDLELLNDTLFMNNISSLFDSLLELRSLEELDIIDSWKGFFNDRASGLLLLTINYLKYKQIKKIVNDKQKSINMSDLITAPHIKRENLIFLNLSRRILPSESAEGFLLNDNQRTDLGLKNAQDRRLQEKYYFYRHLFSSNKAIIFYIYDLENNISCSPFVEELRLNYNLELEKGEIKTSDYGLLVRNIFKDQKNKISEYRELSEKHRKKDKLPIEVDDFNKNKLFLGYYKYTTLTDCYYKFYLQHISNLQEDMVDIERELSLRIIGIMAHEIFADSLKKCDKNFSLEEDQIKKIIQEKFQKYDYKINRFYLPYYRKILLKSIIQSVLFFLRQINKKLKGEITKVSIEWSPPEKRIFFEHDLCQVFLSGRIDLLINTSTGKYIFDFKTGSGDKEQLDFYSILQNPDLNPQKEVNKYLYDIFEEKLESGFKGTEIEFKEKIEKETSDLLDSGIYHAIYKNRCKRCDYIDICRVVLK